jgi:hypothetical protein
MNIIGQNIQNSKPLTMNNDIGDYREDYIERENSPTFYDKLDLLIYFFEKMNI